MAEEKLDEREEKIQKEATEKLLKFFRLCTNLFGLGDNSPYDINELSEDNEFHKQAVEMSKELEIDWKKMTHEESNRIMLAMLDDLFNSIRIADGYSFILNIVLRKKEEIKKKKK